MKPVIDERRDRVNRRRFLASTLALGAASLLGHSRTAAAEPPPEMTKVRIVHAPTMCLAPQYLVEDLLRAEGFVEVEYVPIQPPTGAYKQTWVDAMLSEGVADFAMAAAPGHVSAIDGNASVVVLAGIHAGCFELFGNGRVQSIRDLKGKTVAEYPYGDDRLFISAMMAYVGMDPAKDVKWLTTATPGEPMRLFVEGKADAFLGFPPEPQELRAKKIGHVILNTTQDRPWSQYFCCRLRETEAWSAGLLWPRRECYARTYGPQTSVRTIRTEPLVTWWRKGM